MKKLPNLLLLAIVGFSLTFLWVNLPPALAQEAERVALVVQFDDEKMLTSCIETNGQALNGQEVLQLSGLDLDLYYDANQDVAVCQLNGQGCEANACFCQFPNYWSYWHLQEDEWVYSGRGSSAYIVQPGSVEGWRWGDGSPPPKISYAQICSPGAGAASQRNANSAQAAEAAGLLPQVEATLSRQPMLADGVIGYLVFGLALVGMGFGLIFILKYSYS